MYINKKRELRGSFPHLSNEFLKNNATKKEKHCLNSSLSMNNIYPLHPSTRQFGKEVKNIINLTVNTNYPNNENLEEKIRYYRKINEELTNILNNYDKNFFDKNKLLAKAMIPLNIIEENYKSKDEETLKQKSRNDNKKCKKITIETKENKDNNISYFEHVNGEKNTKLIKKIGEKYIEKTKNININNKDNNICLNEKNNFDIDKKVENNNIEIKDKYKSITKENKSNLKKSNNKDNLINNNNLKLKEEINNNININTNPQEINDYFEEIFYDIQLRENSTLIDPNYLKNTQKFINRKMRAILIDWLIDVHKKYKLKPETLYLTVNIIDRYLSKKNVETINLQLVGVVAFLISSKYEDIYPPKVKELAEITDGAYIPNQLLVMEEIVLSTLNFDLFYPTQWHFLECYRKKLNLNDITFYFAWFLMELALIDINIINYKGSIIASSAVLLSMKNFKIFQEKEFENATGFTEKYLENCVNDMNFLWINNKNEKNLSAVRRKFSHTKFLEVSKIKSELYNN